MALDTSGLKYGPVVVGALAFAILFWAPFTTLLRDWWSDPEAGHGLLLGPVAVYLAWKRGLEPEARPRPYLGLTVLIVAVFLRYVSSLAAELFTMRFSMLLGAVGLILFAYGFKQLVRWWLPLTLIALSIPLPAMVLNTLALPLQFKASQMGAAMLEARHVPVLLQGNVIRLPGRSLFVTEACSGLRSLTSLIALGVLIGGMWLRKPSLRLLLVLLSVPIAVVLNGVRVFLTGFLVVFVDPRLGDGLLHLTEGWGMFVIAFAILGGFAWMLYRLEHFKLRRATA